MPGADSSNFASKSIAEGSEEVAHSATNRRHEALILDLKSRSSQIENERRLNALREENQKLAALARETAVEISALRLALIKGR